MISTADVISRADARTDESFSREEVEIIRRVATKVIEEARLNNEAGMAWFGCHLEQIAGARRARQLLGKFATKVYG